LDWFAAAFISRPKVALSTGTSGPTLPAGNGSFGWATVVEMLGTAVLAAKRLVRSLEKGSRPAVDVNSDARRSNTASACVGFGVSVGVDAFATLAS